MALSNRSQLAMLAERNDEALRWGERAIAVARALGDTETLVHAQTNVGTALADSDLDAGLELLDAGREAGDRRGSRRARRPRAAQRGLDAQGRPELRARARACWSAASPSCASARSHLRGVPRRDARADRPGDGRLGRRLAAADGLVAQPRLANAVARIPALEVAGLVALRRGQPGRARAPRRGLGAGARDRRAAAAAADRVRPRGGRVAGGRRGRRSTPRRATRSRSRSRSGTSGTSASCCCGGSAPGCPPRRPSRARSRSRASSRATPAAPRAQWAALGEPYAEALALLGARDPEPLLDAHRAARPARRDRRGRPRARPAAPRRRHRHPARSASRDAREPGRADRPPARGARARGAGTVESARSRGGCSSRPRPSSITSRRCWPSSACAPAATSRGAARRLGIRRAQLRGPARPSWGRLPDRARRRAAVASARPFDPGRRHR